jgi:hypothetical protein
MIPDLAGEGLAAVIRETALELRTDGSWYITIENDYSLARSGRPALETAAGEEDGIVEVLSSLVGLPVRAGASTSGGLTLKVGDAIIRVAAAPTFESWSMVSPDQQRVVSTPGGELVTWGLAEG